MLQKKRLKMEKCSKCRADYGRAGFELEVALAEEIELEGGVCFPIEYFEEMRLLLASFLQTDVLNSLLFLYKELEDEPKEAQIYSYFLRNSTVGADCKYALGALKRFKEQRLDRLEPLLKECLVQIEKLRSSG